MDSIVRGENSVRDARGTDRDVLIDGHVHVHDCFALTELLDAAAANFAAASRTMGLTEPSSYVLLLADTDSQNTFARLLRAAESERSGSRWSFIQTVERTVIAAERDDDARVLFVSGQQVQTNDGLEVLALCGDRKLAGRLGVADTVAAAYDAGAVAVLPWGFGKWRGKRGALVDHLIRRVGPDRLALGDNSARLALLGEPAQFRVARKLGIRVLAGTDPLPFRGQEQRVGRYGAHFRGPFDENRAGRSIRALVSADLGPLITYGSRERLLPFVVNQARMQLRKRFATRHVVA